MMSSRTSHGAAAHGVATARPHGQRQGRDGRRPYRLSGMTKRVAVVTGSSGGVGSAVVDLFQSEAWHVVGLDRSPPAAAVPDEYLEVDIGDQARLDEALA